MSGSVPQPPASWILNEKVRATVLDVSQGRTDLLIERIQGPGAAVLSITENGRMLTNYQDVDVSDDFPAYLGIFDQIAEIGEHVKPGDSVIMDDENLDVNPEDAPMGLTLQIDVMARRYAGETDVRTAVAVLRDLANAIENPGSVAEDASPILPENLV